MIKTFPLVIVTPPASGFYNIDSDKSITVDEFKQTTTWGPMILEGQILIDGQLRVEV